MMLNFKQEETNQFIIFANTISDDSQTFGDFFLFGFQNGFTKEWVYVIPTIVLRNTRFIKFSIQLVPSESLDSPFEGIIYLSPSMNWDYKLWNLDEAVLDPSYGTLLDKGQMILDSIPPEVAFTPYVSNNETLSSWVYYSSSDIPNKMQNLWNYKQGYWGK